MRHMPILALLASALLLSGCALDASSEQRPDQAAASPTGESDPASTDTYLCGSLRIPASAIEDPTRIAELDAAGKKAIDSATYDDGLPLELDSPEEWIVAVRTESSIALIRPKPAIAAEASLENNELADYYFGPESAQDFELVNLTTDLWPGWAVQANSSCALTVDLGDLVVPHIWVEPDIYHEYPDDVPELRLLVLDPNCGGDTDMPARIEVVSVEETRSSVRVLLGVHALGEGAYTCQGFPPTPYTLTLSQPLGEREVIDASHVTRRVIRESTECAS